MTTIRTVEELAALPPVAVVATPEGHVRTAKRALADHIDHGWRIFLPLTVLHRPDLPTQADLHAAVETALADLHHVVTDGSEYAVTALDHAVSALHRALNNDTEEIP